MDDSIIIKPKVERIFIIILKISKKSLSEKRVYAFFITEIKPSINGSPIG